MDKEQARRRRGRVILVAIAALFIVPMSAAFLWFASLDRFGAPEGSTAKGELIVPVRALDGFSLPRWDGSGDVSLESLRGRWVLVYIAGPGCDDACARTLIDMRQARLALGKDMERVVRLYLLVDAVPDDGERLAREHGDLVTARVPASHPMLDRFRDRDGAPAPGSVWLIDPLGNLMMRYAQGAGGRPMLDDLKRLLRLSRVG